MSSSSTNKFSVFNEESNVDINNAFSEFMELNRALERGESWYDIMYPRGENITVDNNGWKEIGKKRKRNDVDISKNLKIVKKPRLNQ